MEAARDAKRKFEAGFVPTTQTHVISVQGGGRVSVSGGGAASVEGAAHLGLRAEIRVDGEIVPAIDNEIAETITRYGWHFVLEDEPDGTVTATAFAEDGLFLKTARGGDHHDALLEVIKDLHPPSQEVRRSQQRP